MTPEHAMHFYKAAQYAEQTPIVSLDLAADHYREACAVEAEADVEVGRAVDALERARETYRLLRETRGIREVMLTAAARVRGAP